MARGRSLRARDRLARGGGVPRPQVQAGEVQEAARLGGGGRPLLDFLSDPDSRRVFVLDGSKELQCTAALTGKEKKKVVYFLKLRSVALTAENIGDEAVSGDLLPGSWDVARALEHMYRACQEVFLPLLANPNNQQGWPEVIVREVIDSFHKLVAGVYVTIGQIQGKTLLPLLPVELSPSTARRRTRSACTCSRRRW